MIETLVKKIEQGSAHPVTLLVGDSEKNFSELLRACRKITSLELYPLKSHTWTIDHARAVRSYLTRTSSSRRVVIISGDTYTIESQQALLKAAEEIPSQSYLIIISRASEGIINTLRSRADIIDSGSLRPKVGEKFLGLTVAERLAHIEKLLKDPESSEPMTLLQSLASIFARSKTAQSPQTYTHLILTQKLLMTHPLGTRHLLEHLALTLPSLDK